METFWEQIGQLKQLLANQRVLSCAALGAAACRIAFGWALSFARAEITLPFSWPTVHLIVVFGELATWAFFSITYRRGVSTRNHPAVIISAFSSLLLGATGVFLCVQPIITSQNVLSIIGCLLVGIGRAGTMVLWLELFSSLAPRPFVLSISFVYVFDLMAYWVLGHTDHLAALLVSLAFTSGALLIFVCMFSNKAINPSSHTQKRSPVLPMRTLFWCTAFSLAYGLGSSYTGLGNSSMSMHLGYALPALLLILFMFLLPRHFDLRSIFVLSMLLMVVGLLTIVFLGSQVETSQLLMSAALASVYILTFTIACSKARSMGVSPVPDCSALLFFSSLAIQAAKAIGDFAVANGMIQIVTWALIAIVIMGCVFVSRESTYLDLPDNPFPTDASTKTAQEKDRKQELRSGWRETASQLAHDHKLTERENAVYMLLLGGRSIQQISERLFIAPSTVRVHASKVYEKFGVHTRHEFNSLVIGNMLPDKEHVRQKVNR